MRAWVPFLVVLGIQEGFAQTAVDPADGGEATVVAFVNVAVVSMQGDALLQEQTVVIQGERIRSIGPVDALSVPPGATVIDGTDRYLIPGLADMHVHARVPFANGPLFLDAGITTVLSLGTRSPGDDATLQERTRSRTPVFMGPTLYSVGPLVSGGETPDEAERIVRENVERGYDLVKVYRDVSPETFARLHEVANRLGIRVTGHAQRSRGMQPIYTHKQDVAHIEEYLYAAFNPRTPGFRAAAVGSLLVLVLLLLTNVVWGVGTIWRRVRKHRSSGPSPAFRPVRRWAGIFTGIAWLFFIGLFLSVPEPFAGVYAGKTVATAMVGVLMLVATAMVGVLMLLVVFVAIVLTFMVRRVLREVANTIWKRALLLLVVGSAWTFVVCSGYLAPRSWRTTDAGLAHIARETAAAGIWVTPNLVVLDYIERQSGDEFYTLIERPEMRYLRTATRNHWINNNPYRVPAVMAPMQSAIWQNYTDLMSRLVGKLHEANVPLLAGSDAVGPAGVLPGSSLHEELSLLVRAGLTPYQALRTATVNAAAYLDAEKEFGRIAVGLRADLVLLTGNPLDDISHVGARVGVMRRGRWFSADELETALAQLAEERK
jgi:imidazolonepropionase-like amidohydrolase